MNPSPNPARFTSAHGRANIVKILLIAGSIATGISVLAEALSLAFAPLSEDQELSDNPMGAGIVLLIAGLALFELIIYWATVVLFCMWLY